MRFADWLTIAALILGPIIAVRLTRYLDDRKEIRARRLEIFKALMATRATTLSPIHVEALNRIDLEFKKERTVIEAWKLYLDHLNQKDFPVEQWGPKRVDLFVELLHTMARVLKYDFDKTHIKNSVYYPRGHGEIEDDLAAIRQGIKALMEGKRLIPVFLPQFSDIKPPSQPTPEQPAPPSHSALPPKQG